MQSKESAGDFHERHGKERSSAGQFNVYRVNEFSPEISFPPNRRDFYKISLVVKGEGILSYADKMIHIKDNAISFTNPMIPYSWEKLSDHPSGYFCMFTEDFIDYDLKGETLSESPLFKISGNHVLLPDQRSMGLVTGIFEQMLIEMESSYKNKYELL